MDDRIAADLAAARIGDLGFDAGAEVVTVLVGLERHLDFAAPLGVEPQLAFEPLIAAVEVAAAFFTTLGAVVPAQRRVIALHADHVTNLGVGDRLSEVVARLDRCHRRVALDDEARLGRDDDLELGAAILLDLETAGRLVLAARDANAVVAERRRAWHGERRVDRAEPVNGRRLPEHDLFIGVGDADLRVRSIERQQRVLCPPAQHRFDVYLMPWAVNRLVGIDVADHLALWLAGVPAAGRRHRHLIAAADDADDVFGLVAGEADLEDAVGRGLSVPDRLLAGQHLHVATRSRLARETVTGEHQQLARRQLGHEAEVRDDDDRVGTEQAGHGLDEVDARLLPDVERHAAVLRIAVVGQHLAPRGDELIGVEQRHLRERRLIEHDALGNLGLIAGSAADLAVFGTDLPAEEAANRAPALGLPVGDSLDPAPLLRDGALHAAELMGIAETGEERERIADTIDAEIELRQVPVGEVEGRIVARRVDLAARQRERWIGRLLAFAARWLCCGVRREQQTESQGDRDAHA